MNLSIKLNDYNLRYDIYQIFNNFYNDYEIKFVEEEEDFNIQVQEEKIIINEQVFQFKQGLKRKAAAKKVIFVYLTALTKLELPWGTLVGIRPSKVAVSLLQQGLGEQEIVDYFSEHHNAREDKAKLCIDIAKVEKKYITYEPKVISVYIGMPFCPTRCVYCSFTSNSIERCKKLVQPYLEALYFEIRSMSVYIKQKNLKIESVYFGGGTPTAVSNEQFETIMNTIHKEFIEGNSIKEFTVECGRADSITEEKLDTMKKYNVHRISINPQTMNDDTLKLIGRKHTAAQVEQMFLKAREKGFQNINMDIIVGLPSEGLKEMKYTCEQILKLRPDSLTVHALSIKRGSVLYENMINKLKIKKTEQEELNHMYEETVRLSKQLNMEPYYMYRQKNMAGNMENIGYALPGKECVYNMQMIEEAQVIIACGADAVSKIVFVEENRIERGPNVKDIREYIGRIEEMVERKINLLNTLYK